MAEITLQWAESNKKRKPDYIPERDLLRDKSRGRREVIFLSDVDRQRFIESLFGGCRSSLDILRFSRLL